MRCDDQWFYDHLKNNTINLLAQKSFRSIHGPHKKPEITLEVLNKNLDEASIKRSRKALDKLDGIIDHPFAELIKYCAITYANFCDEIYAGLDDFYFQSITMEWLLHSESGYAQGRYRDHLTHQLKVTLLGIEFLKGNDSLPALAGDIVDKLKTSSALNNFIKHKAIQANVIDSDLVMAAWLLAGMFHDIGYCFLMHIKTGKQLAGVSGFFEYDIGEKIWEKVSNLIEDHSYITQFYRTNGEGLNASSSLEDVKKIIKQSAFEGKNHSVIGALYLLYMLNQVETRAKTAFDADQEFKRRMQLTFELAALAILTHDIDSPSKQKSANGKTRYFKETLMIPFDEYPLSYLLGICDQLQDWGRRRVVREPSKDGVCIERHVVDCDMEDISVQDGKLATKFHASSAFSYNKIVPSFWFFGAPVQLGQEPMDSPDPKTLLKKYSDGRAHILSFVYGECPKWNGYSLSVEAGGTTFSPGDYFSVPAAKHALV